MPRFATLNRNTQLFVLPPFLYNLAGENGDSSLMVSLEINSVMYQGVLFAQPSKANNSKDAAAPAAAAAAAAATDGNAVDDGGRI